MWHGILCAKFPAQTGRAAYAPIPGRLMIEPHLWAVGSHLWQALKMRAPSNGTGKLIGIFLRSRDWTENIALVADTVMDMTASTVNRELFIHCRSNWASPSSFSAIPLWLWVAGQNEHSSGWWYGIVPYCTTALIKKDIAKRHNVNLQILLQTSFRSPSKQLHLLLFFIDTNVYLDHSDSLGRQCLSSRAILL